MLGDQAYRELHGMLGEGKDKYVEGLHIVLFLLDTDKADVNRVLDRLKVLCRVAALSILL